MTRIYNHKEEIQEIQNRLNALNYDCCEDGVMDDRTVWAIRWFRRQNALPEADFVDEAMLRRLWDANAYLGVTTAFQYYSMEDPMWAEHPYDAANTPEIERMYNSGCGPTSMAMAVSTALHRAVLPPVLADWSNAHGFRDPDGIHGTLDTIFPACAKMYGLTAELVPVNDASAFHHAADALEKGASVISNVVPGSPFTKHGHYNLISTIESDRIHICDPVPKNNALPVFTVQEWLEGHWARRLLIIEKP